MPEPLDSINGHLDLAVTRCNSTVNAMQDALDEDVDVVIGQRFRAIVDKQFECIELIELLRDDVETALSS